VKGKVSCDHPKATRRLASRNTGRGFAHPCSGSGCRNDEQTLLEEWIYRTCRLGNGKMRDVVQKSPTASCVTVANAPFRLGPFARCAASIDDPKSLTENALVTCQLRASRRCQVLPSLRYR